MLSPSLMQHLLHPFALVPDPQVPAPETMEVATGTSGKLLRKARQRIGFTQQMLADFAQVGISTIKRAECGEHLRIDSMYQICQFFSEHYQRKVTPEELGLC